MREERCPPGEERSKYGGQGETQLHASRVGRRGARKVGEERNATGGGEERKIWTGKGSTKEFRTDSYFALPTLSIG